MDRVSGRLARCLAAAAIAALAFWVSSASAEAQTDSDGYVPVVYSCSAGGSVGSYEWYSDGYTTTGTVYVNTCLLDSLGAGPNDYQRVIDHEMGHSYGYGHSGDPYSVMYPAVTITGTRRRFVTIRKFALKPIV